MFGMKVLDKPQINWVLSGIWLVIELKVKVKNLKIGIMQNKYVNEDGTPYSKERFLQKLKTDREFNDGFGNKGIDQISELIRLLKENPDSRRMVVSAWAVHDLPNMVLPPCHYGFQVYTRELSMEERQRLCAVFTEDSYGINGKLTSPLTIDWEKTPKRAISLMWNQRSCDLFLGIPFNIASYGLLLEIIAKSVNMIPDELIGNLGDVHLYSNHIEQAKEQIGRDLTDEERYNIWFNNNYETGMERYFDPNNLPDYENDYYNPTPKRTREPFPLPKLNINTEFWKTQSGECGVGPLDTNLQGFEISDFEIVNYQSHPTIKAPLSN
jgi:thymidylate synthase